MVNLDLLRWCKVLNRFTNIWCLPKISVTSFTACSHHRTKKTNVFIFVIYGNPICRRFLQFFEFELWNCTKKLDPFQGWIFMFIGLRFVTVCRQCRSIFGSQSACIEYPKCKGIFQKSKKKKKLKRYFMFLLAYWKLFLL